MKYHTNINKEGRCVNVGCINITSVMTIIGIFLFYAFICGLDFYINEQFTCVCHACFLNVTVKYHMLKPPPSFFYVNVSSMLDPPLIFLCFYECVFHLLVWFCVVYLFVSQMCL